MKGLPCSSSAAVVTGTCTPHMCWYIHLQYIACALDGSHFKLGPSSSRPEMLLQFNQRRIPRMHVWQASTFRVKSSPSRPSSAVSRVYRQVQVLINSSAIIQSSAHDPPTPQRKRLMIVSPWIRNQSLGNSPLLQYLSTSPSTVRQHTRRYKHPILRDV